MPYPKNKVKYNLNDVFYAVQTLDENGMIVFSTPKPIPDVVNLNLTPQSKSEM